MHLKGAGMWYNLKLYFYLLFLIVRRVLLLQHSQHSRTEDLSPYSVFLFSESGVYVFSMALWWHAVTLVSFVPIKSSFSQPTLFFFWFVCWFFAVVSSQSALDFLHMHLLCLRNLRCLCVWRMTNWKETGGLIITQHQYLLTIFAITPFDKSPSDV